MEISVRNVGRVDVVDVDGQITFGRADEVVRHTLDELLDSGSTRLLLNLSAVSYMDSSGIGELVRAYRRAQVSGATVKLLKPDRHVSELLRTVRLDRVFECYQNEDEALASF